MPTKKKRFMFILTDAEKETLLREAEKEGKKTLSDFVRARLNLPVLSDLRGTYERKSKK